MECASLRGERLAVKYANNYKYFYLHFLLNLTSDNSKKIQNIFFYFVEIDPVFTFYLWLMTRSPLHQSQSRRCIRVTWSLERSHFTGLRQQTRAQFMIECLFLNFCFSFILMSTCRFFCAFFSLKNRSTFLLFCSLRVLVQTFFWFVSFFLFYWWTFCDPKVFLLWPESLKKQRHIHICRNSACTKDLEV